MAVYTPWLFLPGREVRLEIGNQSLILRRLQLGDSRRVRRRDKRVFDLVLTQRNRPLHRSYSVRFGAFLREGDTPGAWTYPRFNQMTRQFRGWTSRLIFPNKTLVGFITAIETAEVSDCQVDILFRFEIVREFGK